MKRFIVILSAGLLAACSRSATPAPVVYHDRSENVSTAIGKRKAMKSKPLRPMGKTPVTAESTSSLAREKATMPAEAKPTPLAAKKDVTSADSRSNQKRAEKQTDAALDKEKIEAAVAQQKTSAEGKTATAPKAAKSSSPDFAMPVQGKVISAFGHKESGLQNDGINIAAPVGAPVHATDAGTVVFANEKKGFGQLILVKHKGGWVSAYAHLGRMLVKPGQHVSKGQRIAEIGQSGGVDQPQLHFEMRKDTKPVNPIDYVAP